MAKTDQARHLVVCDAGPLIHLDELGGHTVYSEDLNHGQTCAGVRVIDPFAG
jgi:predicted nucleic acid-binding protein